MGVCGRAECGPPRRAEDRDEGLGRSRGSALLPVILVACLVSAIALTITVVVPLETRVASRFEEAIEARYAAEAGLSIAVAELRTKPGWSGVVSGAESSALAAGLFAGVAGVPGGGRVTLCCGAGSASARLVAETRASPLPSRRVLEWRPYYWGAFDALIPFDPPSRLFVIVWIANDEEDGGGAVEDRNSTVRVRAEAIDPAGLRRSVEALVARPVFPGGAGPQAVEIVQWREVR